MIWYKQGCVGDLHPKSRKVLGRIADAAAANGEDVFVTSIRDGNHALGSLHPDGNAFDIRPLRTLTVAETRDLAGPGFDVVPEGDHWHYENDY